MSSKIYKYANIYDQSGQLLRHVDENGVLQPYTIEELEELADKLGTDKDEEGRVKDPTAFNNVMAMLFRYYSLYGNPHATELINKLTKSTEEQAIDALTKVNEELDAANVKDTYEEIGDLEYYVPFKETK